MFLEFRDINPALWNAEESSAVKEVSLSLNLNLDDLGNSHNSYRRLHEKPHATQQLTAVLNHIRLNQECCLSD